MASQEVTKGQVHEHHFAEEDRLDFGKSKFRGRDSVSAELERALAQLRVLLRKNWLIICRRVLPLVLIILLPTAALMVMFLGNKGVSSTETAGTNYPSYPLQRLGPADVAHSDDAVRVAFSPNTARYSGIMENVALLNDLEFGADIIGFPTNYSLKKFVAKNLGKVQFCVFFVEEPLWSLNNGGSLIPDEKHASYVVFSNGSSNDGDPRTDNTGVNFPLLTLQKTLDESILLSVASSPGDVVYNADYGTLWSYTPGETIVASGQLNTTDCDLQQRDFGDLATAASWVFPILQMMSGVIVFQLVTEERSKHLFSMLRRLGLYDSIYWASWLISFLCLNMIGATVAVIFSAALRSEVYAFAHIDLGVIFTFFLVSNTCSSCLSLFLASVSNSSSANTAVVITVFITLVFTIAFCSTPLNEYQYNIYFDDDAGRYFRACTLRTSSYNTIYSKNLLGSEFVEFLVFFMPWFHCAQAITNILSVVQYDGETFKFSDLASPRQKLSYYGTASSEFDSQWVEWSYGMMLCSALIYIFFAWFFGLIITSDISEGRNLSTIFFPPRLRQLLWHFLGGTGLIADPRPVIMEGDIRGLEKAKSLEEKSIRGYKVSKTFSSVQALKEISFTMNKGEVFVILGHNGAGKSTLINIITGQYATTHGNVYVSGMDVVEDISLIQQSIGVCPQSDLLWDDLTAREHIDIHAAFKGIESGNLLNRAVDLILQKVGLAERGDSYARDFSGGMKRRLAVAMSAVGEVDAIFLDEPTTGLDPLSRHGVWDVINWLKGNKVVVLTTHNMEEADFLGDNILIMHEGKKKAFGNSLFLKENYGRGYQINLVTNQSYVPSVEVVLKSALPGSSFIGDSTLTGYMSVSVSRRDVFNLPRFFAWLESSPEAVSNIREWGISNTTLEQVFLMLCKSSTDVNFVDNRESEDSSLCPMCRIRPKEIVLIRNIPGQIILLPEAVCAVCTVTNHNYFVSENDFARIQQIPYSSEAFKSEMDRLLASARDKATLEYLQSMHFASAAAAPSAALRIEPPMSEPESADAGVSEKSASILDLSNSNPQPAAAQTNSVEVVTPDPAISAAVVVLGASPGANNGCSVTGGIAVLPKENPHALVKSTVKSQVEAVLIKNVRLQSLQKCSNICGLLFVGIMFLFLYVFSLLFSAADSIKQCSGGYITFSGNDCNQESLINHIFAGRDDDTFSPQNDGPDNKPLGFTIQEFISPTNDIDTITPVNFQYIYYASRGPVLWTNLLPKNGANPYYNAFYARTVPNYTSAGVQPDDPSNSNAIMFANQMENFKAGLTNGYPRCPAFAPLPAIYPGNGIYLPTETGYGGGFAEEFSRHFASASFDCPSCEDKDKSGFYFNGSLWVAGLKTAYRFSFLAINGTSLEEDFDYLPTNVCPESLLTVSNSPEFSQWSDTRNAMTYLNLLTNTIFNASYIGKTLPIQIGTSEYGNLFFNAAFVARAVSLFLSIFAILLMNGTWPLSVWRLSYERSARIALMMKTVGMRPYAYVLGMYIFDMIVSCIFSVGAMVGAVELNLSRFRGAPLAYLVLTAVLSAHALSGVAILLVQVYSKRSTLLSLLAAVFSIASTIGSLLLIVIKYPEQGDWPNALSIIPFFAQSRCVFDLLVYHEATDEVNIALALLFVTGTVAIAFSLILEYEIDLAVLFGYCGVHEAPEAYHAIAKNDDAGGDVELGAMTPGGQPDRGDHSDKMPDSMCCACSRSDYAIFPMKHRQAEADEDLDAGLVDEEVTRENEMMTQLTDRHVGPDAQHAPFEPPAHIHDPAVAIGISKVRHTYPTSLNGTPGTKALRGVSLRICYGECFGLLGPNGSGTFNYSSTSELSTCQRMILFCALGKSTLISALSGHIVPKFGSAIYIAGHNIAYDADIIHSMVGVCPQEDIVWSELNVEQHLLFQAKQRGVAASCINAEVQRVALLVNLDGDALLTPAAKLSGGMKRRLSIGMAIVGDPPILYLDECTAGLDPENKHAIWKIIQKLKSPHRCILFSSHSMEEVETLSTRIAILVKGRLQCVGSSMHLKKKYGDGYSVTVNILKFDQTRPDATPSDLNSQTANDTVFARHTDRDAADVGIHVEHASSLDDFIINDVANGQGFLITVVNNTRKYRIDKDSRSISDIFMLMESNKAKYHIREWGISMATLEEVFISAVERATENEKK